MSVPTVANAAGAGITPGMGEPTPVQTNGQPSPLVMNVANYLRDNKQLKRRTGLLNNKDDIEFFRYKRYVRALLSDEYKKKSANPKNELIPVNSAEDAGKIFIQLITGRLLLPVEKLHYKDIKAVKGWKPNRQKPTLRPTQKASLDPDAYYAWIYQKPNPYLVLYGLLMLVAVFAIILFPLWPAFLRRGVWYLSMGVLGLLGLLFATAIVRLIVFVITWAVLPQAFWIFPNLFEDCGFFESFQPAYGWAEPAGAKKKKKSKKSKKLNDLSEKLAAAVDAEAAKNGGDKNTSSAEATGAKASTTQPKKRAVILEEVEDN
ncbi:Translocation protein S62 [Candidozyma auris]|uniref:Translocation protein SEC62 n=2 Tax=Candidozyma auris TaxID=498019 RepID=A0A2H1A5Y4_CANAR|nr:Sec63 complex subunit SEC62 [[Candida] auris]KNE01339.2 hypothetical protein QG37_01648 [[Candida] auris]PIS57729.1 hypothetical protein CJI97_000779 [[Candida] auris]PIS58284.1 hypothetical protein B9J08_000778 [[Candida] auris]PSK79514.1 hypothetical protein CJJ07_000615 [[Candida] auris]QEL60624.1 hypothetical protein CJJ09_002738 [[Candida] auris]